MANLTIKTVTKYASMSKAGIGSGFAMFWNDAPWADKIVEGAVLEMELEDRPNYKDKTKNDKWIKSVDGVGDKKPQGGGKRQQGPVEHKEDPARLSSIEKQVALKEVCLLQRQRDMQQKPMSKDDITEWFNFYLSLTQ